MAKPGMAALVSEQVDQLLSTVRTGNIKKKQWSWILQFVDFKGSGARLKTGTVIEGSRQAVPYLAFVWDWKSAQSYSWVQPQHINVLGLLAFLNYFHRVTA